METSTLQPPTMQMKDLEIHRGGADSQHRRQHLTILKIRRCGEDSSHR